MIHCAGLKAVGESPGTPVGYYRSKVQGSLNLLCAMDALGCKRVTFLSSATVYGIPQYLPVDECHPVFPMNAYGRTKAMVENIIWDWAAFEFLPTPEGLSSDLVGRPNYLWMKCAPMS